VTNNDNFRQVIEITLSFQQNNILMYVSFIIIFELILLNNVISQDLKLLLIWTF